MRPLLEKIRYNFRINFAHALEQYISYDEAIIRYFGSNSLKQFIRGKPVRFGYKAWCMNSRLGYCIDFQICQGKSHEPSCYDKTFEKCTSPLLQFIDAFPQDIRPLNFQFYFDNLFTSLNLLIYLKKRNYGGTGTVREGRMKTGVKEIPNVREFNKKPRG